MATDEWKQDNPKVSGHIPKSLKAQLDQFIKDQGLKGTSEALRIILEGHFNDEESSKSSQPVSNSLEERLKAIESRIENNSKEIFQLKQSRVINSINNPKPKSSQPVSNRSQLTIFNGWLTTGEAYTELQKRGYKKSQVTFRRTLRHGKVPPELERMGLIANFEVRNQANPKDNSVRWLKFN